MYWWYSYNATNVNVTAAQQQQQQQQQQRLVPCFTVSAPVILMTTRTTYILVLTHMSMHGSKSAVKVRSTAAVIDLRHSTSSFLFFVFCDEDALPSGIPGTYVRCWCSQDHTYDPCCAYVS